MIAITPGEPAGIGIELVAQLAENNELMDCVLVGDENWIRQSLPVDCELPIQHIPMRESSRFGQLNPRNSAYVLATIEAATLGCMSGAYQAMVTCPIHKGIINDAGIKFSGHTEYLAELTETKKVVMMLLWLPPTFH